jgi:hypothetical protein
MSPVAFSFHSLSIAFFFISFIARVSTHSFIAEPGETRRTPFGDTPHYSAITCGAPKSSGHPEKLTYKRGQAIEFKWPRNNHPAGFIRLSIVPFEQSDSREAFEG